MGTWTLEERCKHCHASLQVNHGITDDIRGALLEAVKDAATVGVEFIWTQEQDEKGGLDNGK